MSFPPRIEDYGYSNFVLKINFSSRFYRVSYISCLMSKFNLLLVQFHTSACYFNIIEQFT